jgi:hypothetical protein
MNQFTPSFRRSLPRTAIRGPESSNTNTPRSGQKHGVVSLCEKFFNQLDSGLRRNDGR